MKFNTDKDATEMATLLRECTGINLFYKRNIRMSISQYKRRFAEKAKKRIILSDLISEYIKNGGTITICEPRKEKNNADDLR